MKGFVVRLVVLSVLWAVFEMLLPDGRTQQAVRFTVSLMIMLSLLGFSAGTMNLPLQAELETSVFAEGTHTVDGHRIYLRSRANQIRQFVLSQAQRAGYQAEATVYLTMDGAVERIELELWKSNGNPPLMDGAELVRSLSQTLMLDQRVFRLMEPENGGD